MLSLRFSEIQNMVDILVQKGLSYSTIKKAYEAASACHRYFRIENRISYDPFDGIVLPTSLEKDIGKIKFFNKEEREKIVNTLRKENSEGQRNYRLGEVYILLMYTGMSVGELCALKWDDIDFENKIIRVDKNAIEVTKEEGRILTQNSAKTRHSIRFIPMTNKAYEALIHLKEITGNEEYIITSSNHNRIRPSKLTNEFKRILVSIGIQLCGVHTLRHTFASMLFNNGCDVRIVSELLGHTNTKVTVHINYPHISDYLKVKVA